MSATTQHLELLLTEISDLEKRLGMAEDKVRREQAERDLIVSQLESAKQLRRTLEGAS